jgi:hypothetical protein
MLLMQEAGHPPPDHLGMPRSRVLVQRRMWFEVLSRCSGVYAIESWSSPPVFDRGRALGML